MAQNRPDSVDSVELLIQLGRLAQFSEIILTWISYFSLRFTNKKYEIAVNFSQISSTTEENNRFIHYEEEESVEITPWIILEAP